MLKVRIQDDEAEIDQVVSIEGTLDLDAWALVKAADKAAQLDAEVGGAPIYDALYIKKDTRKGNTRKIITDWRDGHEMPTRYTLTA